VPRPRAASIIASYVAGVTWAHLLTTAEVVAIVVSLCSETFGAGRELLTRANLVLLLLVVAIGTAITAIVGYRAISGPARWYATGRNPDDDERRAAIDIGRRQSVLAIAVWAAGAAVMIIATPRAVPALLIALASLFGALSTVSTSLLFTQRTSRPLVAAATQDYLGRTTAPGVLARLIGMWVVNCALPSLVVVALVLCRRYGWLVPASASVDIPVVVLMLVSVGLGLRALIVVSLSISDPIGDVVEAMAEVEQGIIGRTVPVYEQSEIGLLQSGFNRMVAGLSERDRLRELFGHHVGPDVARLAMAADPAAAAGDVRDVAVLFIDLTESTQLAVRLSPQEVAEVFNAFFAIVVAAVDDHGGLINKFQGDAALAVFGAPLRSATAADDALATARALGVALRALPMVDFGIGVSAGSVFAGNIGAANRYEYTVIGDPVNEAARLADAAKKEPGRTLVSSAVLDQATGGEGRQWRPAGARMLRGRPRLTQTSVPVGKNGAP